MSDPRIQTADGRHRPFSPAANTPFEREPAGSSELTIKLLSIVRLLHPRVLLPATTALGTAEHDGRGERHPAGANVIMPNLSPLEVREKYLLYDGKIATGDEAAESIRHLTASMKKNRLRNSHRPRRLFSIIYSYDALHSG